MKFRSIAYPESYVGISKFQIGANVIKGRPSGLVNNPWENIGMQQQPMLMQELLAQQLHAQALGNRGYECNSIGNVLGGALGAFHR